MAYLICELDLILLIGRIGSLCFMRLIICSVRPSEQKPTICRNSESEAGLCGREGKVSATL